MNWNISNGQFIFDITALDESCNEMSILRYLTDNGLGHFIDDKCVIFAESVYELTEGQRRLLSLPQEYPCYLNIKSEGLVNQSDFKYIPVFSVSKEYGAYSMIECALPVVKLESSNGVVTQFLLPKSHYMILKVIESYNTSDKTADNSGYKSLARIKPISDTDSSIVLSDYLKGYNIIEANSLALSIDYRDGILDIKPDLIDDVREMHRIDKNEFTNRFDRRSRILPVYTIDGERDVVHKVLIPAESYEKLTELKTLYRRITDPSKVAEIIESPELYLDESYFDLKEFYSDRVIEIGLYKPVFYSFVSPYKSQWLPGFRIEDKFRGTTNIILDDQSAITGFENAIIKAKKEGFQEVTFRGCRIPIDEAERFVELAKTQLQHPKKPVEKGGDGKKVLIIEDNAESLGYMVDNIDTSTPPQYTLYPFNNLREEYSLKPHQTAGIAWLQHLVETRSKGCILADDMGLGKTLQVLCFIDWHSKNINTSKKPYLIVAPVSLLDNWKNEASKFMKEGAYNVVILHGGMVSKKPNQDDIDWLQSQDIILTNYETVRGGQFNICAVDYAAVILDEAQKIKTPGTYVTCAAKALKADFKIAMTGTPVENTYLDLWCIMDFAIPGLLGNSKEFAAKYQNQLKHEDTDIELLGKELREKMGVFFLRRCKTDVLKDLPKKIDYKKEVPMTSLQEKEYLRAIAHAQELDDDGTRVLELLGRLRRISDSSLLVDKCIDHEELSIDELVESSGKIKATLEILDEIKNRGEKVIIFCIYKESQRLLQRIIQEKYHVNPRIINGDTKVLSTARSMSGKYSRQQAIDAFEATAGFNVIIMSPIAAGMGLNVTAANNVIHFGRHWNPAKESQATDRAYRIGQERDVNVYYPITCLSSHYQFASFEQTLDKLLGKKIILANATLFPTDQTEIKKSDFDDFILEMKSQKL